MTTMRRVPFVLMLLLTSCREERAPVPVPPARSGPEEWSVRELTHAPRFFLASGWAGADTLWGLAGNTPVFVSADAPEYRAVRRRYWDAALSSRGALAGIDERGVWVDDRLLLDRSGAAEGDLSGPLLWSPGGSRLLARRVREGPPLHLVVEAASGAVTSLRADSLWLDDPLWTRDGRILLAGRGGLYLHDPAGGALRRVARATAGGELRPLALWGAGSVLVGERENGSAPFARFRLYDTGSWKAREIELPAAHRVIARDSATAVLVLRREGEHDPVHEISLWRAGPGAGTLMEVRGREVRVAWSLDGGRLAVSAAGEDIDAASGSVEAYYRTWIAELR